MDTFESLASVVESLRESASAETVYGDPIVTDDRTVVPVARVAYGFGGGFGTGGPVSDERDGGAGANVGVERENDRDESAVTGADSDSDREGSGTGGSGGGMGGGVTATPVGVVEITASGTRVVRFGETRRLLTVAAAAGLFGLLLGRVTGRSRRT
ncbi:MAG: GerW family sporulation protein [Haloferacaceae archaeon]